MTAFTVRLVPCLTDNYAVLIHLPDSGATILVDAPEDGPIRAALGTEGWRLSHVLLTHHHGDHVQAVPLLRAETGAAVIGPAAEADKLPALDRAVADGDRFAIGGLDIAVIATPGHTLGEVSYFLPAAKLAFTGDTLFSLGCGRVFEGTPEMMWASLETLKRVLPDDTSVYCGHEYTASNARFALSVDGDNAALAARAREVEALRAAGRPTLPVTMAAEKAANPFLRADEPALARAMGLEGQPAAAVFAAVRRAKDTFK
ncbi:hydroxyacylglutathione hydrolase [Segnochrobactrum spirostomi]|uniref:Hydroxyacylglutathione hydrolase n=1 Tax=Segnochrobactrum spirostomi TaxID=2608987 RepID=A0A6A7Y2X1_9HYPH|nr:hydroxyacylglutathione hydrolase [Segnochrobactrum spirostomi]MQT13450.1 hydroxyacylglutathione hydrolase [Segnochrobactrum spirostomi]